MQVTFAKKFLAAAIIGVAAATSSLTCAAAGSQDVVMRVNVQKELRGSINWEKGAASDVEAVGVGLPPVGTTGTRATLLARRAAVVDAYRMLAEMVNSVQLDAETTMEDLAISSDVVRTKVSAMIKGARIVDERANSDGSYTVKIAVPLYGTSSVADVALPELKTSLPAAPTVPSRSYEPSNYVRKNAASYTGVIIDARGLGLEATFSPVVYDSKGRGVYGMRDVDKDYAIHYGMVAYASSVSASSAVERAGSNPLIIKATAVRGGGNSVNPVNVVISQEDADALLYSNNKSGILDKHAVVFVK